MCYYSERAVVSLVRCHMATCSFCHSGLCMSFASGRQVQARGTLCHHSCHFYLRVVSTIFPWLWDGTPNFITAQAWSIFISLFPGHTMWYSCGLLGGKKICKSAHLAVIVKLDSGVWDERFNPSGSRESPLDKTAQTRPSGLDLLEPLLLPPSAGLEVSLYAPWNSPKYQPNSHVTGSFLESRKKRPYDPLHSRALRSMLLHHLSPRQNPHSSLFPTTDHTSASPCQAGSGPFLFCISKSCQPEYTNQQKRSQPKGALQNKSPVIS